MEAILTGEPIPRRAGVPARHGARGSSSRARPSPRRRRWPSRSPGAPRSRCGQSRQVVLATWTEDDETLKKMTDAAMADGRRTPRTSVKASPRSSRSVSPSGRVAEPVRRPRKWPTCEPQTAVDCCPASDFTAISPSSQLQPSRHRDQAGRDAGALVEVLDVAVAGQRVALDEFGAGVVAPAIAAANISSPNPSSRASGSTYTWSTCTIAHRIVTKIGDEVPDRDIDVVDRDRAHEHAALERPRSPRTPRPRDARRASDSRLAVSTTAARGRALERPQHAPHRPRRHGARRGRS